MMMQNPPYNPDDMNSAVSYANKIRSTYVSGDVKKAYKMFLNDPNGTTVTLEKFIKEMDKVVTK